jgi:predicted HTH domain antitoxin
MSYKLTINIPESAFSVTRQKPDDFAREILHSAVVKWYEQGKVSQSKAAEICDMSRQEFMNLLIKYEVAPIQISPDELSNELYQ